MFTGDVMNDILLVEDDDNIAEGIIYYLNKSNYNIKRIDNYDDTVNYLEENKTKLILLDIALGNKNGIDLYQNCIIKHNVPTIFLTANDDEENIVTCFNLGIDDYITKPFRVRELEIRIRKVLERNKNTTIIKSKNIKFDTSRMIVYKDDIIVNLTSLEMQLLYLLFENINKVVRRNIIIDKIWEITGNDIDDHTVTVYFNRIREKIGDDIIVTVKGIGYRVDGCYE